MNIVKKIFAAFTAAISIGVLAMASITASAEEKSLSPAENAPYTVLMGINADKELWDQKDGNFQTFSTDGDYTVSYSFQTGGSNITTLVLDTNLSASSFPSAKITVNKIAIIKAENGYAVEVPFDSSKAVQTTNTNGCHRLNILYNYGQQSAKAISSSLPEAATINDTLAVNLSISGVAPAASTTAATTLSSDASSSDSTTTLTTPTTVGNATSNVSQTADPGVIAIIVTGTAAAALAAGALTMRKKRK